MLWKSKGSAGNEGRITDMPYVNYRFNTPISVELIPSEHRYVQIPNSNYHLGGGRNEGINGRNISRPLGKVPLFMHGFL
jgi:hypothetical protein